MRRAPTLGAGTGEQFGVAPERINRSSNGQLLKVEPAVTGADLRNQVDVPEYVGVLRGVLGETHRLPNRIRLRVVLGVDNVRRQALAILAHDEEVREEAARDGRRSF